MSLLDAARRLVEAEPIVPAQDEYDEPACVYCDGDQVVGSRLRVTHQPDCPWLSMPKIIAALEAAERAVDPKRGQTYDGKDWSKCRRCHMVTWGDAAPSHGDDCMIGALVAALKDGEDVTS